MTPRVRDVAWALGLGLLGCVWAHVGHALTWVRGSDGGIALWEAGARSAADAWRLGLSVRALLASGLSTTTAGWPEGGRVFLPAEAWLPVDATGLSLLRTLVVVAGTTMLLARAGASRAWAGVVAAPVVSGAVGAMAWVPLGAALLLRGTKARETWRGAVLGLLGGLALAQGADVALAGLALAWSLRDATSEQGAPSRGAWVAAGAVLAVSLSYEAWAGLGAVDAWIQTGWTGIGVRAAQPRASVGGIVGIGHRVWAGAALLVLLAATGWGARRDPRARAALVPCAIGFLFALGPHLAYASGPVVVAGRGVPLPALALAWAPPFRAAASWEGWCVLAWVGGALGAAVTFGPGPRWREVLALAGVAGAAVFVQTPGWIRAPVLPAVRSGDVVLDVVSSGARDLALLDAQRLGASSVARPGSDTVRTDLAGVVERPATLASWQSALRAAGVTHVRVASEEVAQAHALRWLLGADARPVAGATWPEVTVAPDPREVPGVASVRWRYRSAQGRDSDWERVDDGLAAYLDPAFGVDALVQVRLYTSDDGDRWRAGPVVAHGLSSLGLTTVGDEALVVTATAFPTARVRRVTLGTDVAPVLLLTTRDLRRWGLRGVLVDPPLALVDPQVDRVDDRWELTAWTHFGAWGQDPAEIAGERGVVRGTSTDGVVFSLTPSGTAPGLADPTLRGAVMHATHVSPRRDGAPLRAQAWTWGDGDTRLTLDVVGASVPFPWGDGARERVVMQAPRGDVWEVTREGAGAWSEPRVVEGIPASPRCESPVAARFRGAYVLLCSERLQEGVAHATHVGAR